MTLENTIGRTITNIYAYLEYEDYGLDRGECFIELDNQIVIDLPYGFTKDVWIKDLKKGATSVFAELAEDSVYDIKQKKGELDEFKTGRLFSLSIIIQKIHSVMSKLCRTELKNSPLQSIKGRKIVDFLWYEEDEKGVFELDNGWLVTESTMAPNGTGLVGLNCYANIDDLVRSRGYGFSRFVRNLKLDVG